MKVVLTAIGSAGDVFPMLGLGVRLKKRGHAVVVIASGHFAPLAARLGLGFVGLGTADDYRYTRKPRYFPSEAGFRTIAGYVMTLIEPLYAAVLAEIEPGNTVVGAHVLDFASRVARSGMACRSPQWCTLRPCSVACIRCRLSSARPICRPGRVGSSGPCWWMADRLMIDPHVVPGLNRLRAERGLAPVRRPFNGWLFSPTLTIATFPEWFAPPQPDWPAQLRLTSFPLFDATEPIPPELEVFLRRR